MRRKLYLYSMMSAALIILAQAGWAQSWIRLSPAGTPPVPRYVFSRAYDAVHDRLMLFSGYMNEGREPADGYLINDAWVLTSATNPDGNPEWIELHPSGNKPPGRELASIIYAPGSNRLIVHGGLLCYPTWCGECLKDTWVLTHANGLGGTPEWIKLPDAPADHRAHSAVYDQNSNRMIVFGGHVGGSESNEVWILVNADGTGASPEWIQLNPTGTPPAPRGVHTAVYDPSTNRMIVAGGISNNFDPPRTYHNDVWILTNANGLGETPEWIELSVDGDLPHVRAAHSAEYDPTTNQLIMFGGEAPHPDDQSVEFNDVWILSAANGLGGPPHWTQLDPSGDLPTPRFAHASGYSASSNRMVIAMGRNNNLIPGEAVMMNDAWVLVDANGIPTEGIDIKPGDYPNAINLSSQGSIPVAILGSATFDAATVDPTTVTMAGSAVISKPNGNPMVTMADVNGDGIPDMVVHVSTDGLQLGPTATEAVLAGKTTAGREFRGADSVKIVR